MILKLRDGKLSPNFNPPTADKRFIAKEREAPRNLAKAGKIIPNS